MPAITVDDITTLQRLPQVAPTATPRRVRSVTTAPGGFEGEGFPVRRAFAGVDLTELDPFIHMDQMGEVEYAPGEPKGTPWHPHRGFETVTYIMDGIFEHQDSNGGGGVITNGDTQWMTAGAGILHIEKPPEHLVMSGGLFHGLQLWVNLPKAEKWAAPRYQDLRGNEVSLLASSDAGALVRVIAGDLAGRSGTGRHLHADDHGARHGVARRDARGPVGSGVQRARVRARRGGDRRASRRSRSPPGSSRSSDRETRSPCGRPRSRRAVRRRSRSCCSAADRSGSPWRGWGRSS